MKVAISEFRVVGDNLPLPAGRHQQRRAAFGLQPPSDRVVRAGVTRNPPPLRSGGQARNI